MMGQKQARRCMEAYGEIMQGTAYPLQAIEESQSIPVSAW